MTTRSPKPKKPKKVSVYLDEATLQDLAFILQHSRTTQSISGALRGIVDRYAQLLRLQLETEKSMGKASQMSVNLKL